MRAEGNPFNRAMKDAHGGTTDSATGTGGVLGTSEGWVSGNASKALADEIRRDDAAMASDLAALAPQRGRAYHRRQEGEGLNAMGHPLYPKELAQTEKVAVLEVNDRTNTNVFIEKKREVGLVRLSLATKRAEVRKLDEEADRAEKRLRQQQEQLESTREKFNNFLKHSNLEQDAAVRRADSETKAKQEKTVEIKKLSAQIGHVELEMKKMEVQLENCKTCKKFLDDVTKPRWFFDVLISLRVSDRTKEILRYAEEEFERRSARARENFVRVASITEPPPIEQRRGSMRRASLRSTVPSTPEEEVVPLEQQVEQIRAEMESEAKGMVTSATKEVVEEVNAMTVDEVREALETQYDEDRMPTYFRDVEQLLEVFINVEEGNLFLIQNCQELEEELERVAVDYHTERADTQSMTRQRHAQMEALITKIQFAQEKMRQLEERATAFEKSTAAPPVEGGGGGTAHDLKASGTPGTAMTNAAPSQEVIKEMVERKITSIFRSLTVGDNAIKTAMATGAPSSHQPNATNLVAETQKGSPKRSRELLVTFDTHEERKKRLESMGTGPAHAKDKSSLHSVRGSKVLSKGPGLPRKTGSGTTNDSSEPGANMGPVEMLTVIENKLEEYHRYIVEPANGVEETMVQAVMKASDKQRRQQARLEHLEAQTREQEERSRKALERSMAPIAKRTGKPVLRRSKLATEVEKSERKLAVGSSVSDNDWEDFF